MTKHPNETRGLLALDRLLDGLPRVPREKSRTRWRARLRLVALALAGTLVVTLASLALGSGNPRGAPTAPASATSGDGASAPSSDDSTWWDPDWRTIDDAMEAGALSPDRGPYSEAAEVDFAMEGPIEKFAKICRTDGPQELGTTALHCEATIAITEGRLPPGQYEDEELREALGG